jgi:hypothetical protein
LRRTIGIVGALSNNRRPCVPGGCWFFIVNLVDRRRRLLTDYTEALRAATSRQLRRAGLTEDGAMRCAYCALRARA